MVQILNFVTIGNYGPDIELQIATSSNTFPIVYFSLAIDS